jgi:hypothetical protein
LKQIYASKVVLTPTTVEPLKITNLTTDKLVKKRRALEESAIQWVSTTLETSLSLSKKLKLLHNSAGAYSTVVNLQTEFNSKDAGSTQPISQSPTPTQLQPQPAANEASSTTRTSHPQSPDSSQSSNVDQISPLNQDLVPVSNFDFDSENTHIQHIVRSCSEKTQKAIEIVDSNGGKPTNASDFLIAQLIQDEKLLQERKAHLLDLRQRVREQPLAIEYRPTITAPPEIVKPDPLPTSTTDIKSPQPTNGSYPPFEFSARTPSPIPELSIQIEFQIPPLPPIPQYAISTQTPPPPPLPPSEEFIPSSLRNSNNQTWNSNF